ncbi:hypothetical protein [Bacillus dakarensis]|uniref:hypothetical protein n=1 Tax=Robertmurraya dakarensis TaxID=1926278 RepID=UPI000980FA9E|nr:hypothetical protein [Bacillus dakarensis]
MITLSSINELEATQEALKKMKKAYPALFRKWLDMVFLTRALQFKYHYLGCLIMNEDPGQYTPGFVHESVLNLYKNELQKLKDDQDFHIIQSIFSQFKDSGYAQISLLAMGMDPESLIGPSHIK